MVIVPWSARHRTSSPQVSGPSETIVLSGTTTRSSGRCREGTIVGKRVAKPGVGTRIAVLFLLPFPAMGKPSQTFTAPPDASRAPGSAELAGARVDDAGARATRDQLACPGCGHRPSHWREIPQHRHDLAITWLYTDPEHPDRVIERRHCAACQPHHHIGLVECAVCGDGSVLAGELAAQTSDQTNPPPSLRRWLHERGWRLDAPLGLVCPAHVPSPVPTPRGKPNTSL